MSIVGVERVVYGVDDLEKCTKFYKDFGLPLVEETPEGSEFLMDEGSRVILRRADDPGLPATYQTGNTVRMTVWGVDSQRSLDAISSELGRDRELTQFGDTLSCLDDLGIPIGFRIFDRKPISYSPSQHNAPGAVGRVNQHRKWFPRATPRLINHVVYRAPDHMKGVPFYRDRLGFRVTDVSKGLGIFLRADGHNMHHNLFFLEMPQLAFDHICFGVEDIDELMVGAGHMKRNGYVSEMGLGRHRIASALFYYITNPCGGEAEYGADSDVVDDHWVPREWNPAFGGFSFVTDNPPWLPGEVPWDVKVLGGDTPGTPPAPSKIP